MGTMRIEYVAVGKVRTFNGSDVATGEVVSAIEKTTASTQIAEVNRATLPALPAGLTGEDRMVALVIAKDKDLYVKYASTKALANFDGADAATQLASAKANDKVKFIAAGREWPFPYHVGWAINAIEG